MTIITNREDTQRRGISFYTYLYNLSRCFSSFFLTSASISFSWTWVYRKSDFHSWRDVLIVTSVCVYTIRRHRRLTYLTITGFNLQDTLPLFLYLLSEIWMFRNLWLLVHFEPRKRSIYICSNWDMRYTFSVELCGRKSALKTITVVILNKISLYGVLKFRHLLNSEKTIYEVNLKSLNEEKNSFIFFWTTDT